MSKIVRYPLNFLRCNDFRHGETRAVRATARERLTARAGARKTAGKRRENARNLSARAFMLDVGGNGSREEKVDESFPHRNYLISNFSDIVMLFLGQIMQIL